jgi:hypothetical protein
MRHRTSALLALAAALLLLPHGRPDTATEPADPLAELNDRSRAAYRRAREEALARTGPVVLVEGDDLVLKYGQQRLVARTIPDEYHVLKAVSHVPLAVHALLAGRGRLDDQRLFDLKEYRERVAAAGKVLARRGLRDEQLARQRKILDESDKLLARAVEKREVTGDDLDALYKAVRPEIDANTADAARAQIDGLHRQMSAWKAKLTDKEWSQLTVVVMGSQMPRRDNLAVQYFARLLGEGGEGRRIIYAEALFDEGKALDLLGTHLVDTRVGEAFFADPQRMHRDLLGDAARTYLDTLFKKEP